jgi:hypothetical protein
MHYLENQVDYGRKPSLTLTPTTTSLFAATSWNKSQEEAEKMDLPTLTNLILSVALLVFAFLTWKLG